MYVVVGSATAAARLRKAIEKNIGFPAYVVHTPSAIRNGGCSYSVRVDDRAAEAVKQITYKSGITVKNIYMESKRNGERVYYALS